MPRISVIMGVYNADRFVEQSVRSVLAQSYRDLELVVIDDGSSDGSLAVLQRLAAEDARIRLLSRPNRGIAATGNELLALARGELIAIMDHDDLMRPECLERLVAHLDATPDCVAACGVRNDIDANGAVIATQRCFATRVIFPKDHIPTALPVFIHPTSLMRADALARIGGYREHIPKAIDYDMWLRLSDLGAFDQLAFVSLDYRWHGANETAVRGWENFSSALVWHMAALLRARGIADDGLITDWKERHDLTASARMCAEQLATPALVDDVLATATRASLVPVSPQWRPIRRRLVGTLVRRALTAPWHVRRWRHLAALAAFRGKLAARRALDGAPELLRMVRAISGQRP